MSAANGSVTAPNGLSGMNGHANELSPEGLGSPSQPPTAKLLEELQVPFDVMLIKWRAHEMKMVGRQLYGLCFPYADPRAYKERLNQLVSPVGWRDKFTITTTPTLIAVTCELYIDQLGCHSGTGEDRARNENAVTSAEAQSFKRACVGFGLGLYLYHVDGLWLALDSQKRPETSPALPDWATQEGWRAGLRWPASGQLPQPPQSDDSAPNEIIGREIVRFRKGTAKNVVHEIRAMESVIGAGLYRGLLKTIARVWNPADIRELSLQRRVLRHMEAGNRGIQRIEAALKKLDSSAANEIFRSLELTSVKDLRDLDTMHRLIVAMEKAADLVP